MSGPDNEPLGIMSMNEAMRLAADYGVDVVEISATAVPPVVRIMDYGKFKYQEQKREQDAKSKQKVIEVKEIKFRPGTDDGDYNIKVRNIRRFLEDGDKVKITLRFRGREITHQELGMALLMRLKDELADSIVVESMPRLEGKQMVMMVAPGKKKAGGGNKPAADKPAGDKPAKPASAAPVAAQAPTDGAMAAAPAPAVVAEPSQAPAPQA